MSACTTCPRGCDGRLCSSSVVLHRSDDLDAHHGEPKAETPGPRKQIEGFHTCTVRQSTSIVCCREVQYLWQHRLAMGRPWLLSELAKELLAHERPHEHFPTTPQEYLVGALVPINTEAEPVDEEPDGHELKPEEGEDADESRPISTNTSPP